MTTSEDEFDWDDVADGVVQNTVPTVAIFSNRNGDVVIRKQPEENERGDVWIIIARGNALRAARAILEAAGLGDVCFYRRTEGGLYEDVQVEPTVGDAPEIESKDRPAAEKPKADRSKGGIPPLTAPLSNAERQRRFKEKRRAEAAAGNGGNGGNDESGSFVTELDAEHDAELPFDRGAANG